AGVARRLHHLAKACERLRGGDDLLLVLFAVVPGQLAVGLDIEREVVGGALGPELEIACGLHVVKGRVHLHKREVARVVAQTPRLHARLCNLRRVERLMVRPTGGSNADACWHGAQPPSPCEPRVRGDATALRRLRAPAPSGGAARYLTAATAQT